jgi:hypothetical protein
MISHVLKFVKTTIGMALGLVVLALLLFAVGLADAFVRAYSSLIAVVVLVCLNFVVMYKNFRHGGLRGIVWDLVGLAVLLLAWTAIAKWR